MYKNVFKSLNRIEEREQAEEQAAANQMWLILNKFLMNIKALFASRAGHDDTL